VFVQTPKVIFSKSVQSFAGQNVAIEDGDLKATVTRLKSNGEKDILVYGGANFASSLLEQHLIDELNLFVHPVSLGKGLAIFKNPLKFELVASHPYTNGIVLNKYKPIV
jgi:dihydrofolate reductase